VGEEPKALAEIAELLLESELFGVLQLDSDRRVVAQHGDVLEPVELGGRVESVLPLLVGYEETIDQVAAGERAVQHLPELRFMSSGAPDRYLSIYILPGREGAGATLLFQDTSEVSRLRQEIMQTKNDLQIAQHEAERAKSRFYGMMSHEIRTPLNGVIGTLQNLLDAHTEVAIAEPVGVALRSARHLLGLLNDILDFSKIEAGRLELESAAVDLPGLVDDVTELMASDPSVDERGLDVRSNVEQGVPRFVTADSGRLRQILLNLVGNALKFTERGSVAIVVAPSERGGSDAVRFEVRDTGLGIPREAQSGLFAEYAQLESSTARRFGGTGLGLTICKRLVELMGGAIGVESTPGEGSTFWFEVELPRRARLDEEARGRVLVVDDGATSRLVVTTMLVGAGHRVDAVANGREAVEAVRRNDYDVVLMDFRMPELDGPSAAAEIRRLPGAKARLPILAMSASSMPELDGGIDPELFDARVDKPVLKKDLLEAVAACLA